jgi:alcohol dehydrogenase
MKALVLERWGGVEAMSLRQVPDPVPADDEMLVEIHAAGVNPVDVKIAAGKLRAILSYRLPLVLGNDLAGRVVRVGPRVTRFRVGDEVFARPDKRRIGTFAEYLCLREDAVAKKPANLSMVDAASVPLAGLTSWQALCDLAELKAGGRVLVHAGSGGVGSLAIQLAKALGAHVSTTCGSANVAMVKELGADEVIDYRASRFDEVLRDVDAVFDTQGGETLDRSFTVLRPGGIVVSISGPPTPAFAGEFGLPWFYRPMFWALSRKVRATAARHGARYRFLFMWHSGEELERLGALFEAGKMRPVIDRVFPFAEAKEALGYVATGRAKGKVVLQIR